MLRQEGQKRKPAVGGSPGPTPPFPHNILYCSVRQSDFIGSAQKSDNRRNQYCFFYGVISVIFGDSTFPVQNGILANFSLHGSPQTGHQWKTHGMVSFSPNPPFYRANYRRVLTMTPVCQESDHSPEIYSVDLLGTLNMNTPSE